MPLNKEKLRLTTLGVQATLFAPPRGPVLEPQSLSPKDASSIYAELARYGFAAFQLVPGGAQMATADRVSALTLTGAGWSYQEDLSRSAFELALSKLDVAISNYVERLAPGTMMVQQLVDLQGMWEIEGLAADKLIAQIYLKDAVHRLAEAIGGLNYQGSGIRLNLTRQAAASVPGAIQFTGPTGQPAQAQDSFDVRVEPLFVDKSKLFLQVVGAFAPTDDLKAGIGRIRYIHQLLWEEVATNIALI
jgi:hypothetical protein